MSKLITAKQLERDAIRHLRNCGKMTAEQYLRMRQRQKREAKAVLAALNEIVKRWEVEHVK